LLAVCLALACYGPADSGKPAANPKPAATDRHGDPLPPGALARLGTTRFRHDWLIWSVAFAPDGKSIFSNSVDGTVRRWDVGTGKEVGPGRFRHGHAHTLALGRSPEGRLLVACSHGGIRVWDADSGKSVLETQYSDNRFFDLAFSLDGQWLACVDGHKGVELREVRTGKPARRLPYPDYFRAVAFTPDGRILAARGRDGVIVLWETATWKEARRLRTDQGHYLGPVFPSDSKALLSAGRDGTVSLWDVGTGKELRRFTGHKKLVTALALAPDGKVAATADDGSREIWLWDTATGQRKATITGHVDQSTSLAFSPDSRILASADGPVVRLWEVATARERYTPEDHLGSVNGVAFSADGKTLASASHDGRIVLWDLGTQRVVRRLRGAEGWASWVALGANDRVVAWGEGWHKIGLWNLAAGKPRRSLKVGRATAQAVTFLPDGKAFAGIEGKTVVLYDSDTEREQTRLKGHKAPVLALGCSHDGKVLASLGNDRTVILWDLRAARELSRFKVEGGGVEPGGAIDDVYSPFLALSPDGRWVACSHPSSGRAVTIWEVSTGKECRHWKTPDWAGTSRVVFAPDGRFLAAQSNRSEVVQLLDVLTGRECGRFPGSGSYYPPPLAFSPDSRVLAVGLRNTNVMLWPVPAPKPRPLAPAALKDLWGQLQSEDAAQSLDALGALVDAPEPATTLLRQRLRALGPEGRAAEKERPRIIRAIAALERIGTPAAEEVLADLARPGGETWLIREAQGSLQRLGKRGDRR
ncbi:MAG: WD40 repeat domain-containing protein, partial [Gemmataceae bacterium]|nr:WD40 repeat domain-containing protein [Gemmataceae bacterium]